MATTSLIDCSAFPIFLVCSVLLFSQGSYTLSSATDTISFNQSLTGNQTIISRQGSFELGFFTPPGNSRNYYVGVWYKKIPVQTVIWVANRATPVSNASGAELKISKEGNLVILNSSGIAVWSANFSPSTSNATVAVLLDTGNLVLGDGPNSSTILWQSFDHPTDTWMPGGWLGVNKITGEYQSVTSWENPENPAPGPFAESMDPDGSNQYVLIWNGSRVYWSSGLWNGQYFSSVPGTRESTAFNFTFSDTPTRKFAMYTVNDASFITRFVIDSTGQGLQWFWLNTSQRWQTVFTQPLAHCDVYSLCGPFGICSQKSSDICQCPAGFAPTSMQEWRINDWNSGCARITSLQCGKQNKSSDGFLTMLDMRLPGNPIGITTVGSVRECEEACLNNCSCNAYSYRNACSIWIEDLRNIGDSGGDTLYIRLDTRDLPKSSSNSHGSTIGIVVGTLSGAVVILLVIVCLIWACRRRKMKSRQLAGASSLVQFSYGELQRVTRNFSQKLGGGGFGSVYRGTLPDSSEVAVKKLEGFRQGEKQFRTEVSTLGAIQHVNLVRLRGFCCDRNERLVVYDYMPGGSLDSLFFEDSNSPLAVSWRLRHGIMLGIARGLAYLHESCRECIIHCDIKPDNILVDAEMTPKIADFGMAKLIGRDFSRVLTTMRGTVGYLAPEWISGLPITSKVDVFSFGMMLFELIAGKRNSSRSVDQDDANIHNFFPSWAAKQVVDGNAHHLLDSRLEDAPSLEELTSVCRVACWCIQDSESQRPTMGQIVQILEGRLEVNKPPLPLVMTNLMEDFVHPINFQLPSSDSSASAATNTPSESLIVHGR